jgi:hypothetical protein
VKRTRKTVTLETKMLVIKKWKLARNVLIFVVPSAAVSTVMAKAEKIKIGTEN